MAINNPYVPGDPYSYDLKWIVSEIKKAIDLYTPLHDEFSALSVSVDELRAYVIDYFASLDLSEEVSSKLEQMAASGELTELLRPFMAEIQTQIASGLYAQDARIEILEGRMDAFAALPDGSTAGDAELEDIRVSAYGLVYDSAGNSVRAQINRISESIDGITVTPTISNTYSGVTFEYVDAHTIRVYGTSTAARRVLCFNGQNRETTSATAFNKTVESGYYLVGFNYTGPSTALISLSGTYTTYANPFIVASTNTASLRNFTLTNPTMLGIGFAAGVNFGTADSPSIITVSMRQISAVDIYARSIADRDSDVLASTGDTTDRTAEIVNRLSQYGYCRLGDGVFYTSGIEMPDGSTLIGSGRATRIILSETVNEGSAITMHKFCGVSNLRLSGSETDISPTADGGRNGIAFTANYDGSDTGDAYTAARCAIDNVTIINFSGSGIYCHNTSITPRQGLYASQFYIANCWSGINIDYYSEFNKFINGNVSLCRYAVRNNSGNNVFTSCTLHASLTAFYIDGTKPNSGHGTINGCTFCHTGSNTGKAIDISNVQHGFIISNSQFWYNSISISASDGILLTGCEFGRGTTGQGMNININGGNLVLISACTFMNDITYPPQISIANNNKVKFVNCFGARSGDAISA